MDRQTELALIDELLALMASMSAFLEDSTTNPADHYACPGRFEAEQTKLFRQLPIAAAHISELPKEGSFVRQDVGGLPILITRDKSGAVHAFLNACRHRGTRLVEEMSGCKHRFSCPYHAWTYASTGELIGAPHFDEGFPHLDKADLGLQRLPCAVQFGFVWVSLSKDNALTNDQWFEGIADNLDALDLPKMRIAAKDKVIRHANWKTLVEGGIEAYHFRVVHRKTIGPHFENNLSSYRSFGPHMRAVLPRTSMATLTEAARDTWHLRDHANILYTLFPSSQLLVMQDHIVWIRLNPLAADKSALQITTLAPTHGEQDAHWKRNHDITMTTLDEDFTIGESIQSSVAGQSTMMFGRFEGALAQFNRTVNQMVEQE